MLSSMKAITKLPPLASFVSSSTISVPPSNCGVCWNTGEAVGDQEFLLGWVGIMGNFCP